MSGDNEHAENLLLFVIVGGLVVAAVFYGIFLFWPYLIFYVLPFLVGSLVVAVTLRIASAPDDDKTFNYKNLAIAYPVMILVVAIAFFVGSERAVVVDKKGNITGQYFIDWPKVNDTFNEYRSSTYANSPFDGLQAKARQGVVYDRREMGLIALWCLFLGGPLLFWYWARDDKSRDVELINSIVNERTQSKREALQNKTDNLDQIIASNAAALKAKISDLERARSLILDENRLLKAKIEFSPDIPKPPETQRSGGVLDSDIL